MLCKNTNLLMSPNIGAISDLFEMHNTRRRRVCCFSYCFGSCLVSFFSFVVFESFIQLYRFKLLLGINILNKYRCCKDVKACYLTHYSDQILCENMLVLGSNLVTFVLCAEYV